MDAEAACILCNWYDQIPWWYFGLGGLGVGLPVIWDQWFAGPYDQWQAERSSAANREAQERQSAQDRADDPGDDSGTYRPPYRSPVYHYTDTNGNPYWPGVSPIPADGVVNYQHGVVYPDGSHGGLLPTTQGQEPETPLPVDPQTGIPVHPPTGIEGVKAVSAQTAGSRG